MGGAGWYVAKARPARLARLREASTISLERVSGARTLVVLLVGVVLTGGGGPVLMASFPKTPLMTLVSVGLAFVAVLAPLTFARRLTVDVRLLLAPGSLRFERRRAR